MDTDSTSTQPPTDNPHASLIRTFEKDMAAASGTPVATEVPVPETPPAPAPVVTPPPATVTPEELEEKRKGILERLREKVGESGNMQLGETPLPQTEWKNIPPPPAPDFAKPPETTLNRIPPVTKEVAAPPGPERMHTYSSDFTTQAGVGGASTFSVLAAQRDAERTATPAVLTPEKRRVPAAAIGLGVLVMLLGVGGIAGTYYYVTTSTPTPSIVLTVPSLVFADEKKEVSGSGAELMSALAAAASEPLPAGNVLVLYTNTNSTDAKGVTSTVPAPSGALIRALALPAPDILLRNLAPQSTVGVINAENDTRVFFVLKVLSYERTFAGMLAWEGSIANDLALLYPLLPDLQPPVTPVGTSTPPVSTPVSLSNAPIGFVDRVVANHDARVLVDEAGRSILLYGYANKETLIIARNASAFAAIISRLTESGT